MDEDIRPSTKAPTWTYAELFVHDGERQLRPTHVCGDEIIFREPPQLIANEIRVTIKNGDRITTRSATVLAHDPNATRIPIQLIDAEQTAPAKLTA
jgi:hypothetical protein